MGALGTPSDIPFIKPFLATSFGAESFSDTQAAAVNALRSLGDCTSLDTASRLLAQSGINSSMSAVEYIQSCGGRDQLGSVEQLARRMASSAGPLDQLFVPELVRSIYHMGGGSSVSAIESIIAGMHPGEFRSQATAIIFAAQILQYLRSDLSLPQESVRVSAAAALAERGDPSGLEIAAQVAADPKEQAQTRASALRAFRMFKGPEIRRFLNEVASAVGAGQPEVHAAACSGLRWYDDGETISLLVADLKNQSSQVRDAALGSLVSMDSERTQHLLKDKLSTLEPVPQVYAALALQRMGAGTYPEVFKDFLKNKTDERKDYAATVQAIKGLRGAYLDGPASAAVEALRDERREVRLAAMLALAGHNDVEKAKALLAGAAMGTDPHFRLAASRASWALVVVRRAESHRTEAALALAKDNLGGAEHALERAYQRDFFPNSGAHDYRSVLASALSVSKSAQTQRGIRMFASPDYLFQDVFQQAPATYINLDCDLGAKKGETDEVLRNLENLVSENPGFRKALREDPNLNSLHDIYEFRVLTGMQKPTTIEHINLPAVEVPKPKS
jgi:hypothetical protein